MSSEILTEQIYYNVSGASQALDYIRQFALSLGWTVDYWSTGLGSESDEIALQLYSPGYLNQNICYRFWYAPNDFQEDYIYMKPVIPGERFNVPVVDWTVSNFCYDNDVTWGGTAVYSRFSLPASNFIALYLFGNDKFISSVWNVNPIAVLTIPFGTYNLAQSWWNYSDGLFFNYYNSASYGFTWYEINDNPLNWRNPFAERHGSNIYPCIYWEGEERFIDHYACNYRPTSIVSVGSEVGEFNLPKGILNWNTFTSKRVALFPTVFCKDPTLLVWYTIGNMFQAYVNGRELSIGDELSFGSDVYRVLPVVFSTNEIWQAYRIA